MSVKPRLAMVLIRSSIDIRTYNTCNLIFHLFKRESLYRKEMPRLCNLSIATVYNVCRNLLDNGIINEVSDGLQDNKRHGRKPQLICLNNHNHYFVVINLRDVNQISIHLMQIDGVDIASIQCSIEYSNLDALVDYCASKTNELLEESDVSISKIRRVGIILSGIYDERWQRVRASIIPLFENSTLKPLLEEKLQVPVSIENDANLAAFYTYLFRNVRNTSSSLSYVLLDEGIGSGIVIDDKLYTGEQGYATEICCLPLGQKSTAPHSCGMYDCTEQHLNINAFYLALIGRKGLEQENLTTIEEKWQYCMQSYKDPADADIWTSILEEKGQLLGTLCSIITMIFDIKTIIFGGRIAALFPSMEKYIMAEYNRRTIESNYRDIEIQLDYSYEEAFTGGANCLAITEWLSELSKKSKL